MRFIPKALIFTGILTAASFATFYITNRANQAEYQERIDHIHLEYAKRITNLHRGYLEKDVDRFADILGLKEKNRLAKKCMEAQERFIEDLKNRPTTIIIPYNPKQTPAPIELVPSKPNLERSI